MGDTKLKKNRGARRKWITFPRLIILALILLVLLMIATAFMFNSYYSKKNRIENQIDLGGAVEIITTDNKGLNRKQRRYIKKSSKKVSYIIDTKQSINTTASRAISLELNMKPSFN